MESAVSQVFIAIDLAHLHNYNGIAFAIQQVLDDYQQSIPGKEVEKILYPGERVLNTRKQNNELGIPVSRSIWEGIKEL